MAFHFISLAVKLSLEKRVDLTVKKLKSNPITAEPEKMPQNLDIVPRQEKVLELVYNFI